MRFVNKRTAIGAAVLIGVGGGAFGAYAYFTSGGTGTGNATVGTASDFEIEADPPTGPALLPGAGTQTLNYTVTNVGDGQQQLTSVVVTVSDDGSGNVLNTAAANAAVPGCLVSWFTVDNTGAPAATTLASGAAATGSATLTMPNAAVNQDPCQGVSPQLTITAT